MPGQPLVHLVLPGTVTLVRGEYIEVTLTRVRLNEPVSPIFRTLLDPNVKGTDVAYITGFQLMGGE